eukprot:TRINITY_DN6089_c0_g1_i3.p1 TRINITY_DN6089_c0_g1~~TRINITY_DN6089_c0_g1_i3.p1  ORF type:complete len:296 (+),score=66.94 TRINITY_DN6089_c0_g1_i3:70-957(+)
MQAAARAEDDDLAVVRRVLQRLDAEPRAALAHPVPPGSCAFACATALEAVLARDPDYLPALFMLRTLCLVSPKLSTSKVPMHFARHEMTQQIYRITRESHRCLAEGNALAAELLETNSVEYSLHFAGLWAYWVREEHALAACIFRRLADAGNTSGMHNLGVSHAFGLGVPRDFSAAAALFRRAAEAGHTGALFNLGTFVTLATRKRVDLTTLQQPCARRTATAFHAISLLPLRCFSEQLKPATWRQSIASRAATARATAYRETTPAPPCFFPSLPTPATPKLRSRSVYVTSSAQG